MMSYQFFKIGDKMQTLNFKRTKLACYTAYFTMSSIFCVPPLLFMTFHNLYNISYTLLGTLVLTNFCTQMLVDLIFSTITGYDISFSVVVLFFGPISVVSQMILSAVSYSSFISIVYPDVGCGP